MACRKFRSPGTTGSRMTLAPKTSHGRPRQRSWTSPSGPWPLPQAAGRTRGLTSCETPTTAGVSLSWKCSNPACSSGTRLRSKSPDWRKSCWRKPAAESKRNLYFSVKATSLCGPLWSAHGSLLSPFETNPTHRCPDGWWACWWPLRRIGGPAWPPHLGGQPTPSRGIAVQRAVARQTHAMDAEG